MFRYGSFARSLLFLGFGRLHHAEAVGADVLVNEPHRQVHDQNGVAHALAVGAKVPDEHGNQAAAHAEDRLSLGILKIMMLGNILTAFIIIRQ